MTERSLEETSNLIARARQGQPEAFEQLTQRLRPTLERLARRALGPDARSLAQTDDVLNASLYDLGRQLPRLAHDSTRDIVAIAARVVENKARDAAKAARRDKRDVRRNRPLVQTGDDSIAGGVRVCSPSPRPDEELEARELEERLLRALDQLELLDRELIRLRRELGLPASEIATLLGITEDAARVRVGRVLKRLAGVLGEGPS